MVRADLWVAPTVGGCDHRGRRGEAAETRRRDDGVGGGWGVGRRTVEAAGSAKRGSGGARRSVGAVAG